jgi:Reverse transcriptase (RNA-dependent DNA polymerase)
LLLALLPFNELLFSEEHAPGEPIKPQLEPKPVICDKPPTEEELIASINTMKLNKSPGASGIRVEHLREWKEGATRLTNPIFLEEWTKLLKIIEMAFTGVDIPSSFCNGILVLFPKNVSGEYRGIALLEVLYKLISSIINRRLVNGIKWHDAIHRFRTGRGTGTAIIEAKLRMQLAKRGHKPLCMIFLDLKKAYHTLDRNRTMLILENYGVGKNPKLHQDNMGWRYYDTKTSWFLLKTI